MKKTLISFLVILLFSCISVTSSFATRVDIPDPSYFSLTDYVAGGSASSAFQLQISTLTGVRASSFGIFFDFDSNGTLDSGDKFEIVPASTSAGYNFTYLNFRNQGSGWEITLDVNSSWTSFDSTVFGFYLQDSVAWQSIWATDSAYTDDQYYGSYLNIFMDDTTDDAYYISLIDSSDGATRYDVLVQDVAPVPEPATLLLLGSGLVGLAFLKRRKS